MRYFSIKNSWSLDVIPAPIPCACETSNIMVAGSMTIHHYHAFNISDSKECKRNKTGDNYSRYILGTVLSSPSTT